MKKNSPSDFHTKNWRWKRLCAGRPLMCWCWKRLGIKVRFDRKKIAPKWFTVFFFSETTHLCRCGDWASSLVGSVATPLLEKRLFYFFLRNCTISRNDVNLLSQRLWHKFKKEYAKIFILMNKLTKVSSHFDSLDRVVRSALLILIILLGPVRSVPHFLFKSWFDRIDQMSLRDSIALMSMGVTKLLSMPWFSWDPRLLFPIPKTFASCARMKVWRKPQANLVVPLWSSLVVFVGLLSLACFRWPLFHSNDI